MEWGRAKRRRPLLLLAYDILMFTIIISSSSLFGQNSCNADHRGARALSDINSEESYSFQYQELTRSSFPVGFKFGVGSSAYQYEGAVDKGGRFPRIWDTFTELFPEKIIDESSGKVADDFYFHYEEDMALLQEIGWDFFRFSISWSRVIPYGKISKGVNQKGIDFYNKLINGLLSRGIQPYVTLFHWDVPKALEDDYGGFLSHSIVDDYCDYVELCFKEFGDRVKYWVIVNEPNYFTMFGYAEGTNAPGRCSNYIGNCTAGDSATEPYIVMHNLLVAHATAIQAYKNKYKAFQKRQIGMTITTFWMKPKYNTNISKEAASRALDFQFGWSAHPITYGDYPKSMRLLVGDRLPTFTQEQSEMLKKSYDFLGVNYYTARYVDQSTSYNYENLSYTTDCHCNATTEKDGIPIGQPTAVSWLYVYPNGIRELLHYIKNKYNNPIIYVTENGIAEANNATLPIKDALKDVWRIDYFHQHLSFLAKAIEEGVRVKGFLAWTFLDDFEWSDGYTLRYGFTYVDYKDRLKRYLKQSSLWFKSFLLKNDTIDSTSPHFYKDT